MRRSLIPIAAIIAAFLIIPPTLRKIFPTQLPPAAIGLHEKPRQLPRFEFRDGTGRTITLDRFRGKFILLNIWATWCTPCIKEVASLDHLAALVDEKNLVIIPISVDPAGVVSVGSFYSRLSLHRLKIYADPSKMVMGSLAVMGIPTTLLVDRDGREIGRVVGAAQWDAATAVERIAKLVEQ